MFTSHLDELPEGTDDRPHCDDCGRVVGEDETPVTTDGRWKYYACCVTPEQLAEHAEVKCEGRDGCEGDDLEEVRDAGPDSERRTLKMCAACRSARSLVASMEMI